MPCKQRPTAYIKQEPFSGHKRTAEQIHPFGTVIFSFRDTAERFTNLIIVRRHRIQGLRQTSWMRCCCWHSRCRRQRRSRWRCWRPEMPTTSPYENHVQKITSKTACYGWFLHFDGFCFWFPSCCLSRRLAILPFAFLHPFKRATSLSIISTYRSSLFASAGSTSMIYCNSWSIFSHAPIAAV